MERGLRSFALFGAVSLLCFAMLPDAVGASDLSPASNRIAFLGSEEYPGSVFGSDAIYTEGIDGSGLTRLTPRHNDILTLAWSPDGSQLVFDNGGGEFGPRYLYTMNADGTGRKRLTPAGGTDTWDVEPAWSPDGRKIAFAGSLPCSGGGGGICYYAIFTIRPNGAGLTQITDGHHGDFSPSWSPNGSRIAFVRSGRKGQDVFTMNANGSDLVRVTDTHRVDFSAAWSPAGGAIAFLPDHRTISRVRPLGGRTHILYRCTHQCRYVSGPPGWSPGGGELAFTGELQGTANVPNRIFVINADGSNVRQLRTHRMGACCPAWQP